MLEVDGEAVVIDELVELLDAEIAVLLEETEVDEALLRAVVPGIVLAVVLEVVDAVPELVLEVVEADDVEPVMDDTALFEVNVTKVESVDDARIVSDAVVESTSAFAADEDIIIEEDVDMLVLELVVGCTAAG